MYIVNQLNEFLVDNHNLDRLEAELRKFNALKILRIEHAEIRHSNVLAWLLDPQESHGFGDAFLKKLLGRILLDHEGNRTPITVMEMLKANLYDTQILREFGYTDIVILSKSNNVAFLIENKVRGKANHKQIARYIKMLKEEFPKLHVIPVFLTLYNSEPNVKMECVGLNYKQVYSTLKHLMELYSNGLNPRVVDFIKDYLKTLEDLTVQENSEVVKLCKDIYRRHKDALEAIVKFGMGSSYDLIIEEFKKGKRLTEIYHNNREFWFLSDELKGAPKFNLGWRSPYAVSFWFEFSEGDKVGLILEVGLFPDAQKRLEFIHKLKNFTELKVYKDAFRIESKYSRVYTKYVKFQDWDDAEGLVAIMNKLYNEARGAEKALAQAVTTFQW